MHSQRWLKFSIGASLLALALKSVKMAIDVPSFK